MNATTSVLLALLLVGAVQLDAQRVQPEPRSTHNNAVSLVVREIRSWPVQSTDLVGGVILDRNTVVAWTATGTAKTYGPGSGSTHIGHSALSLADPATTPSSDSIPAILPDDSTISWYSRSRRALLSGGVGCRQVMSAGQAAVWERGILVVVSNPPGHSILAVEYGGDTCTAESVYQNTAAHTLFLTPGADGSFIISSSDPAQQVLALSVEEDGWMTRVLLDSLIMHSGPEEPHVEPRWHALPVLYIGEGYFRVTADLRSENRVFQLWNRKGELIKFRMIRNPIAFVASDPRSNRLLGMRMLPRPELVLFGWEWASTGR